VVPQLTTFPDMIAEFHTGQRSSWIQLDTAYCFMPTQTIIWVKLNVGQNS